MRSSFSRRSAARTRSSRCCWRASRGRTCHRATSGLPLLARSTASPISISFSPKVSPRSNFLGTSRDKSLYTTHLPDFLATYRPDVVHFQHTVHIGFDAISTLRRVLPEAPILYTLHEYLPICHRHGQMLRTPVKHEELCTRRRRDAAASAFRRFRAASSTCGSATSRRISPRSICSSPRANFFDSATSIGASQRIASSARTTVAGRRSGWPSRRSTGHETDSATSASSMPYKGVETLLEAMATFGERPDIHPRLHGANLDPPADRVPGQLCGETPARRTPTSGSWGRITLRICRCSCARSIGSSFPHAGGRTLRW